jgi:serine/threonine protein kinase
MEKCPGGEVFEKLIRLRRFTENDMIDFCKQVFSAIEYIHSLNIIHRDIKAENFLYAADGSIKLIDFGLAVKLKSDTDLFKEMVGSAHYIAPEMLDRKYSKPVDIWSAGVLVYLMLYGRYPFDGETDEIIMRRVKIGAIAWDSPNFTPSATVSNFLNILLERDPSKRIDATTALSDPFLSSPITKEGAVSIIVTGPVIDFLSDNIVTPTKCKRKGMLLSAKEKTRSAKILDLEHQFELGHFRGWRRSRHASETTVSAPTSPNTKFNKPVMGRQSTKGAGLLGGKEVHAVMSSPTSPMQKRAKSLPPGALKVKFDSNPPDLFVYTEGVAEIKRIASPYSSPRRGR